MAYLLRCKLCSYQNTAEDVDEVFDNIDAHQEAMGEEHFMDYELIEEEPLLRGGEPDKDAFTG